ncbi:MAG: hypothetical protein WBV22_08880 [Anaerolineaceae bacterium]
MKTEIFVIAENANLTQDGKINIFAIFNKINSPQFPTVYPRPTIVIKLALELGERPDNRKVTLYFAGEDSNSQQVKMFENVVTFPQRVGGLNPDTVVILNVNAIGFEKPGMYQFILHVDDNFQASLLIYAELLQQPPQLGA